jgi:hypothetical protein
VAESFPCPLYAIDCPPQRGKLPGNAAPDYLLAQSAVTSRALLKCISARLFPEPTISK